MQSVGSKQAKYFERKNNEQVFLLTPYSEQVEGIYCILKYLDIHNIMYVIVEMYSSSKLNDNTGTRIEHARLLYRRLNEGSDKVCYYIHNEHNWLF